MDFVSSTVRFRVIGPSSDGPIEMDSWTVEGDTNYARRVIIRLGYKYMNEVVNDALYDPEDCSLVFLNSSFDEFSMPKVVIKNNDNILYSIESYKIIQLDQGHFEYRGYEITVDASDSVLHVVDGKNGFYKCSYDIVDHYTINKALTSVYEIIDLELDKGENHAT